MVILPLWRILCLGMLNLKKKKFKICSLDMFT